MPAATQSDQTLATERTRPLQKLTSRVSHFDNMQLLRHPFQRHQDGDVLQGKTNCLEEQRVQDETSPRGLSTEGKRQRREPVDEEELITGSGVICRSSHTR
jgi:hypothetical protein